MDKRTMSKGLRAMVLPAVLVGTCARCYGHCDGPPPPPQPPPPPSRAAITRVYPPRWSWLHWWEANRDPYLKTLRQDRDDQRPDQKALARFRSQAVEALLEAMRSSRWQVRASAALALGRMGEQTAAEPLKKLAGEDEVESVRIFALVALGLLDCTPAEQFLLTRDYPTLDQREAALAAIGLMTKPGPDAVVGLQKVLRAAEVGPATIGAWGLKFQTDPANARFLRGVLDRTRSAWLASEAILALGHAGDVKSVEPLADILLATPRAKLLPAWQELEDRHRDLLRIVNALKADQIGYEKAYEQYLKTWREWRDSDPNAKGPRRPAEKRDGLPVCIILGVERIYQTRLRASAAIALGRLDHPNSPRALEMALEQHDDEFSDLYKGFVIMSLGQLGDSRALPALGGLLSPTRDGRVSAAKRDSPLRGYAALALGLYARPVVTPQGPQDRPQYDKVCRALAERVADHDERMELRTAAALALGLTGRTENLKLLRQAGRAVRPGQDVLIGYMLLGQGMLGDKQIVPPARKFLAVGQDRVDTTGILARRAAVLGLGVLGSPEAVPILMDSWHLSYYVNREVAMAFSLCQVTSVAEPLVKLLKESKNVLEQAYIARCLGELFASRGPEPAPAAAAAGAVHAQRLCRLIHASNYTMKNLQMIRLQALANEFLFAYLIPAFGEEWR